jgi:hypothetical protein
MSETAPHLSGEETRLLKTIGRALLSDDKKARMRELKRLRDAEQLSSEGYAELAAIIDELEQQHAERMFALAELAKVRGVTLETAMKQVGLNLPDYE